MTSTPSIRINKLLSEKGYCSRRQADALIAKGAVTINGQIATLGDRALPTDEIKVDGKAITSTEKKIYLALNKPVGITCTTDQRIEGNVIDFVNFPERVFHVGRLDKPSEGLLLLTNDGDIVNKILRAGNQHEKEYIVEVDRPITSSFLYKMSNGVPILDTRTKPCKVYKISRFSFRIILTQGLNRQIRRMCEHLDYAVTKLQRVRIMHIQLGNLEVGKWRHLTAKELDLLQKAIQKSSNTVLSGNKNA